MMLEQSCLEGILTEARHIACDREDGLTRSEDAHLRIRWEKVREGRRGCVESCHARGHVPAAAPAAAARGGQAVTWRPPPPTGT